MLPDRFLAFVKKCIYKENCGTVMERKHSVKNIIIGQISLEHLTTAFLEL